MLIHFLEGARLTQLVQLIAGIETPIASGTQYEMTQKSEAVAKLWIEEEQFRRHPEDKLLWESFENTVALAKALGFSFMIQICGESNLQVISMRPEKFL